MPRCVFPLFPLSFLYVGFFFVVVVVVGELFPWVRPSPVTFLFSGIVETSADTHAFFRVSNLPPHCK